MIRREPEDRSQGNYRLYSDESLSKLKFIRAAQAIGFTLDDVKDLRHVQRVLKGALTKFRQSNPRDACQVLATSKDRL